MDCGHVVAKFLKELDVKHIFGLAGSHINPIYDGCFKENIMVIGTRHEQAAAFMADTYSRLSRSLGVCVVTAGPGFTNALTGIAQAYLARSPVLLISGHSELTNINKGALQELDQKTLARPITVYSELVLDANRINDYLIDAAKCALFEQRPSHLAIPIDVLSKKVQKEVVVPKLDSKVIKRIEDREAEKILNMLKNAKKPVIIAGSGVWKCFGERELVEFVETTEIPVFTHEEARGIISDEHDLCFGDSSPAVNPPAVKISEADVVLAIGVNFDFRLAYGSKLKGKVIHVSSFYEDIWKNLTPEIGLVTNEKDFLSQMNKIAKNMDFAIKSDWIEELRTFETKFEEIETNEEGLHPLKVMRLVSETIDEKCTVILDGGDSSVWCRMAIKAIKPLQIVSWGPFRALGHGIPSAISAKLVRELDDIILVTGDGSVGFNIMEFETAARYSIPFVCIVLNDSAWGMVYHDQVKIHGREVATLLTKAKYEEVAEALGGKGAYIQDENEIVPTLKKAIKSKQPYCLNVEIKRIPSPVTKQYIEWRKSLS